MSSVSMRSGVCSVGGKLDAHHVGRTRLGVTGRGGL